MQQTKKNNNHIRNHSIKSYNNVWYKYVSTLCIDLLFKEQYKEKQIKLHTCKTMTYIIWTVYN